MVSRRDMSCFCISVWMHDVVAIPAVRLLAVPEPGSSRQLQVATSRPRFTSPKMLWYHVRFWVVRWLVGEVPSSSESGSEAGDHVDGAVAPPAGPVARRRRRRAHMKRRVRHGADAEDVVPEAPGDAPPAG
jgi:hypothetical protein